MSELRVKNLREHSGFHITPSGWCEVTVEEICHLGRGRVISHEEIKDNPGPYPVYSSQTRDKGVMGYLSSYDFASDLVTWTTDGENAGTVFFRTGKFSCTNVCGTLKSRDAKQLDLNFLSYHLSRIAKKYVSYIGNPKLMNGVMGSIGLILPGIEKQQRIAEILSTVDEAIWQTEALIAKTQQIKAGLMHDLFTRGVTPDGHLRPPREEAPHLYKESPLGWIPKEWGCETLGDLLAPVTCPMRSGPFGSALLKEELVENGIPLLGIDNVFTEHFVAEYRRFVTPYKFVELNRYGVFPHDVIITIMGTVGRCCVVPEEVGEALSSKHLWTMTFDRNKVLPELVCWQLNYALWVKAWFARQSQGAVMDAIQSSTLRNLRLPVPQPDEQLLLRDRYIVIQNMLAVEEERLNKLSQMKRGLMHDLLTGRVRVNVSEPATA